jgi:ribonucleoside-triphosphate reductase
MEVRKSEGYFEEYNPLKVKHGICEAYTAVNEVCPDGLIESLIKNLLIYDRISSSEIRRQIEEALMSVNKKVARAYIKKYEEKEGKDKTLKTDSDFIRDYINASNASTGSKYDSNANVENKNVVTLGQELHKGKNIQQNRYIMQNKIKALYSKKLADQYIKDLESHVLYKHDESGTPGYPYCVAITMYPFLIDGLKNLGGQSKAPTDLKSYCGEFINLVYSVSSQFMGAVATPEFLMYMDYFIRKDYGEDYLDILDKQVEINRKGRTLEQVIENCFQQVVHSMNMPAGNRGYQTVFWNVGYFDKNYFDGVFGEFRFPDGTAPKWETLSWLQKKFMKWFNEERTKYVLTFPVETMAMLTDGHDIVDKEYADFTAEMWSEGHSFFCYLSDSPDSLSSCCRLRNSLKDGEEDDEHNHTTHQFSMGTASVATGSKSVMTINLNRVIQNATRKYFEKAEGTQLENGVQVDINRVKDKDLLYTYISSGITEMTERVHKYQRAFNEIVKDFLNANMLDVYRAGFINMKKQYLTIGVNGLTDAAEFLSIEPNLNKDYEEFVNNILETINISNRKDKTRDCMYNTEFVPGENLSNKNYNWDKKDGYYVSPKHIMYSSYFFNPEDTELSLLDKMKLHGESFVKYLDGGQAAHLNINEHLSFDQYRQLLRVASEYGCSYFTFNCKNTVCNDCGYISKDTLDVCPKCGSHNIDYISRIIGYLKRISSFNEARQVEAKMRYYNEVSHIM